MQGVSAGAMWGGQHAYEPATLEISTREREGLVYLHVRLGERLERSCVNHSQGFPFFSHHGKTEAKTHLGIILKTKLELCGEKESLFHAQDLKVTHRQLNFISKSHK